MTAPVVVLEPKESQLHAGERLAGALVPLCGHLNVLHAQLVRCTVDALATNAWGGVGITSPEHWLCLKTGVSPGRATQVITIARRWHELPVTMAAFSVGELSIDQVEVVVRTVRSCDDARACDIARHALVSQLRRALRRYRYGPDPTPAARRGADGTDSKAAGETDTAGGSRPDDDPRERGAGGAPDEVDDVDHRTDHPVGDAPGPGSADADADADADRDSAPPDEPDPREARALEENRVSSGFDDDGRFFLHADLDALAGALVDQALREARNALFNDRRPDTWADALVEIATRSLGAITNADRRDLYRVYLHVDAEGSWVDNGPAIPSVLFDQITCDGTVVLLAERAGRPVGVSEPSKVIPNHLRRLVLDRDRHCRFPGCGRRRHLELHHVVHRADLGSTTLTNLAALCPLHHRLVHRRMLRLTGNADVPGSLTFRDTTGQAIREHRPPPRPQTAPPGPPPGHRWRHPTGERLHADCLHFPDPPPDYRPPPGDPPATRPTAA
jgi:hypothetical protein